jgi:protein kinase A
MSVEMTDVSEEERMREKAREAQEQAAAAAANLHHATQQARVAAINAAATQAALDSSSGKTPITAQPLRKTAGRYALADFAIERT